MVFTNALSEQLNEARSQKEIQLSTPEKGPAKNGNKLGRSHSEFFSHKFTVWMGFSWKNVLSVRYVPLDFTPYSSD